MIGKTLIAAAAIAATFAVAPAPEAKADVDVDIGIGVVPGGYYGGGYTGGGYYRGYDGGYNDDGYGRAYGYAHGYRPYRKGISCGTGRNIVADAGFYRVRPVDCELPGYRYTAKKNGHKYMVRVNARGNIVDVSRIY